MTEGRKLDARVAERVMGFRWYVPCNPKWKGEIRRILWLKPWSETSFALWDGDTAIESFADWDREIPHYSTSIAGAWSVVEKMRELGYLSNVLQIIGDRWVAQFDQFQTGEIKRLTGDGVEAESDTAPLAICLAALKAVEASCR